MIDGDILEIPIKLAAYYGLRKSEVLGLKWSAIDFKNKTISIRHAVSAATVNGKHTVIVKDILKNKSSFRTLPLIPYIEDLLVKERQRQRYNAQIAKRSYDKEFSDYICVNPLGKLISPDMLTSRFANTIIKKNNLPKIRFHDLRHTCASLLIQNGVTIKEIQEWLGHSNFSTTANIYSHLEYSSKVASGAVMQSVLNF